MARMSIDDSVQRDPRITKLARLIGWSRRETLGCLVSDVWPITYDQRTAIVAADLIDLAAGHDGFAQYMVSAELASWVRGNRKVRINGAEERIEYLDHKRRAGRVGGIKSGESRHKNSSIASSDAQARGNPPVPDPSPVPAPDPVPSPVPDLSEKNSAAPSAGGPPQVDAFADSPRAKRTRKPKPSEPTADEREAAMRILEKLSGRNGVRYSGAAEHVRLIAARLRDGVDEMHLRYVVAYCAAELGWADDAKMSKYLRPETLFGPQTIAKYLDAARTWAEKLPSTPAPGEEDS